MFCLHHHYMIPLLFLPPTEPVAVDMFSGYVCMFCLHHHYMIPLLFLPPTEPLALTCLVGMFVCSVCIIIT